MAGNSAKTADVIFEIPVAANQVVLQVIGLTGKTEIPVPLTPTQ